VSSTTGTKVVKAQPNLIPKGKGDNSMAGKYGEGIVPIPKKPCS